MIRLLQQINCGLQMELKEAATLDQLRYYPRYEGQKFIPQDSRMDLSANTK